MNQTGHKSRKKSAYVAPLGATLGFVPSVLRLVLLRGFQLALEVPEHADKRSK